MSNEQAVELADVSREIGRQVGVIIDRRGRPFMVLVGDPAGIFIPDLSHWRRSSGRLKGLRLVHTHLRSEALSQEDLMDLLFLRLDSISALTVQDDGRPGVVHVAHLLPPNPQGKGYEVLGPFPYAHVDLDYDALTGALEDELAGKEHSEAVAPVSGDPDKRAVLVGVSTESRSVQERSVDELADLAETAGLEVAGTMIQRVQAINPRFIVGKGKLAELETMMLQGNAGVLIFNGELAPGQIRNLAEMTERKVLDRSQLILDIFAQHARTKAGKLQVELAQLQYTLPRLVGKNRALSRLAGGIGGRGPGEQKLELDRRKIRTRITFIKKELEKLRSQRKATRIRRAKAGIPVVALVGYTNAGKSTLLNTLTGSSVLAENKLFATLDPTTRRLRFPMEREIILTDTVGFIRQLPEELKEAFRATLEELESADMLIHVVDTCHPELEELVEAVETILEEMDLGDIPRITALNKWDKAAPEERETAENVVPDAVHISALSRDGLEPLVDVVLREVFFSQGRHDNKDQSRNDSHTQEDWHPLGPQGSEN